MPTETLNLSVLASALTNDLRAVPAAARAMGFTGLLFDAYAPALAIPDLSASGRREFRHLLSSQDQQLVGLRADLGPKGFSPGADVDHLLRQIQRAMESAAALAAPLMCVDLGPLPEPPPQQKPRSPISPRQAGLILLPEPLAAAPAPETSSQVLPPKLDPTFAVQVDGALVELGRLADRYSATVALRTELSSFAALDRAIRQANCPWFGVDLDPVAIIRDPWSLDETLSRLGPLVRHVRVRDAARGADRRTQPTAVGRGSVDWGELLAALDAAGYHGWLTVDPTELADRPTAARAARAHLLQAR